MSYLTWPRRAYKNLTHKFLKLPHNAKFCNENPRFMGLEKQHKNFINNGRRERERERERGMGLGRLGEQGQCREHT
jgi:hypothetical protein